MKHIWFYAVISAPSLVSSAQNVRIKRQFPFLLGHEYTEQAFTPHPTSFFNQLLPTLRPLGTTRSSSRPLMTALQSSSSPSSINFIIAAPTSAISNSFQSSTQISTSVAGTPTVSPTSSADASSASKSSSIWQIAGIAVSCITVVGVIILSVAFFDQWSRFLKDVLCGKKAEGLGEEELLPEKNWAYEIREGRMSNLRYPAQIFSPPLDALPLRRAVSKPARQSFLKRFSTQHYARQFRRLSGKHDERLPYSASIHPSINVGDIYPGATNSAHDGLRR